MQCSSKVEDDPTGQQHHQPDDDPLPQHRSQEIPVKNCEGGGEGKGIESVGEKTKVSGHYSAPPSADSTRSYTDKIQTDNNNDVEKKITNLVSYNTIAPSVFILLAVLRNLPKQIRKNFPAVHTQPKL